MVVSSNESGLSFTYRDDDVGFNVCHDANLSCNSRPNPTQQSGLRSSAKLCRIFGSAARKSAEGCRNAKHSRAAFDTHMRGIALGRPFVLDIARICLYADDQRAEHEG